MRNLLRANFARLRKNRIFWLGIAIMLAFGLIACLIQYRDKMSGFIVTLDSVFALPYIMSGILLVVLCSLFIGTEYSDGTIRNKLVAGRSRSSIYLANFVVSATAGLLMNLVYLAVVCAVGIPLLGYFSTGMQTVLMIMLTGMLLTVSFAALFTMLAMLNQSKALSAILCSIGILAAISLASYLYSALSEPELIEVYQVETDSSYSVTIQGTDQAPEMVPNPRYLTGVYRAAYQFLMDFLPSGQMVQLVDRNTPNLPLLPLYSIIVVIAANGGGVLLFRRKDLK